MQTAVRMMTAGRDSFLRIIVSPGFLLFYDEIDPLRDKGMRFSLLPCPTPDNVL